MSDLIQIRRGTAAQWTSGNPILEIGEMGYETDTDLFKIGNGVDAWSARPYGGIAGAPGVDGEDGAPGATTWGGLGGTLSNQTDLQNALNAKQAAGSYEPANANIQAHVAQAHAPSNAQKNSDITLAEIEAKLTGTIGSHTHAGIGLTGASALPATTGTMTANMAANRVLTITPTGACTFNASGGTAGNEVTFAFTTNGTSSFVMTFGTNFRKVGTLATGTVSARFFSVSFVCVNGTIWQEMARTAVQT